MSDVVFAEAAQAYALQHSEGKYLLVHRSQKDRQHVETNNVATVFAANIFCRFIQIYLFSFLSTS